MSFYPPRCGLLMTIKEQLEILKRGTVDLVNEEELVKKLESGKQLVVKFGADPTRPDLHLGHSVVLNKLRQFQDLGHKAALVIGDFTASIGDPSGRDTTRPILPIEQIKANAETYTQQAFKILDREKTEIRFNSEWLMPFIGGGFDGGAFKGGSASPLLSALSKVTVAQLLEREDFRNRMKEGNPVTLLEMLYPVFQGYDSVALKADVELGGRDQLFNLLMGRNLQRVYGEESSQIVMTMPLLVGTDGVKKMSKSYGNYVGLTEDPKTIFGKLMSLSDDMMWNYYELLTDEDLARVKALHPMEAKKSLAAALVARLHTPEAGKLAREEFERVFSKKELPQDMPLFKVKEGARLSQVIFGAGLAPSMNEARRLITQGAVKIDGNKQPQDQPVALGGPAVLQVGSRRFCRLEKE